MLRKSFAVVVFALALACGSVLAADAREEALAAAMAEFANQPELTQADIDAYLEFYPKAIAAGDDREAAMKLHEEAGLSRKRVGQITIKIRLGMVMAQGTTREQIIASGQMPDFMLPTDVEVALIKENMPDIMRVMESRAP